MSEKRRAAPFRLVPTKGGVRLMEGGLVLSEIVDEPGPTHSLFDVLAACVTALVPGHRVAVLGFAGGGIVAPLRAMGFGHPLRAVDLSLDGESVFREHAGPWAGEVQVAQGDAAAWLRRQRTTWDLILEDLSIGTPLGVTKPAVSLDVLPSLIHRRLRRRGVAVTNVLPVPGLSWGRVLRTLGKPWRHVLVVHLAEYENRLLVACRHRLDARAVSHALRRHLVALGSDQRDRLSVRSGISAY